MAGAVNLTVPGGAAGEAALPLRLLDGFSLYVLQSDGSELLAGLEQLENGAAIAPGILLMACMWRELNRTPVQQ